MRKKRVYKRKRGPVVAKKVIYDGIHFASGLEKYMYKALKQANIKAKYEGETFVLINGFHLMMMNINRKVLILLREREILLKKLM